MLRRVSVILSTGVLVIGVLVIAEKGFSNIVNRVFVIIIINRGFGDC